MKKDRKRLLIVDDEKPMLDALVRSFSVAQRFEFETTALLDLKDVVSQELEDEEFDVCITDLGFGPSEREVDYHGFLFIAMIARNSLNYEVMRIVYSGHPEIQNVVRAMQLGATAFVSKSECPPHMLVERVEAMLIDRQEREVQNRLVYEFLGAQHEELSTRYPGRVVAIAVSEAGPMVVADGRSRLDVLLKYANWRRSQSVVRWPVVPHLHIVPPISSR